MQKFIIISFVNVLTKINKWASLKIVIEIWRYLRVRVPVKYHPVQWSMIFVIGTYSLATIKTSQLTGMQVITDAGKFFLCVSIVLWIVIFLSMIFSLSRLFLKH